MADTASTEDMAGQAAIVAFLSNPAAYPSQPSRVERIETHGALVFLAGNEVYKIKRAVRFPYMDFSTLALRKSACQRELDLNLPHAPDIYLGVVPVTRESDGRLVLNGPGTPVEWAVHMARFDQQDLLSAQADIAPLAPPLATALADAVYDFHASAPRKSGHDSVGQTRSLLRDVVAALHEMLPATAQAEIAQFQAAAGNAIANCTDVLARRAASGYVRRCHGDLHLGNIVIHNDAPVLFDALEFDEGMATTDTLYDLAFLLMDLDCRNQRPAANRILNRYLWRTNDIAALEGLAALPIFLALRAAIRAMVRAQRARQMTSPDSDALMATALHYLEYASRVIAPEPARLLLVGGLSGSGKSTLAQALAPRLGRAPGALHLRSDLERKSLFGAAETERLAPETYTPEASARVYTAVLAKAEAALRAGQSVVADAVYAKPEERAAFEALAGRRAVSFRTLWLDAPAETLIARVASRKGDASDATPGVVIRQTAYDLGSLGWTRINASGSPSETLQIALRALEGFIDPP